MSTIKLILLYWGAVPAVMSQPYEPAQLGLNVAIIEKKRN